MIDKINSNLNKTVILETPHLSKMNLSALLMNLLLLLKYTFICVILFVFYKVFSFFGLSHYLIIFTFIILPLNFLFRRSFYSQEVSFWISYVNNIKYASRILSLIMISVPYYLISFFLCVYGFLYHQYLSLRKKYNETDELCELRYLVVKRVEYSDFLSIFIFRYESYSGRLVNGNRHGQGRYIFWNGDIYDGDWKDDRMYGEGSYTPNLGDSLDSDSFEIFNKKVYVSDDMLTIFDGYLSFLNNKYFYLHACLASIVCFSLFYISYLMIEDYTNHGEEFKLRSYKELGEIDKIREAIDRDGLEFVERDNCECVSLGQIDSMRGMMYSQLPEAGTFVKEGRPVLFTFVCYEPCEKEIPEGVRHVSTKIAILKLQKYFKIQLDTNKGKVNPDEDVVTRLMVGNKEISEGDMVPEGSLITMYYDNAKRIRDTKVPNLIGKGYTETVTTLRGLNLYMEADYPTGAQDSLLMNVYEQWPSDLNPGDSIIYIRFQLDSNLFNGETINDTIFE